MDDTQEQTCHERLQVLEESNTCQQAQIEVLRHALSDLLIAHAMKTNDAVPIARLRECCERDYEIGKTDGTTHITASIFANRSEAFSELLREIFCSDDLYGRYWRRSIFEWLDERRYKKIQKMKKRIDALSDV